MSANLMSLAQSGGKFLKLFGDRKMMNILPYDAEVEYLQKNGSQWIDTGIEVDDGEWKASGYVFVATPAVTENHIVGLNPRLNVGGPQLSLLYFLSAISIRIAYMTNIVSFKDGDFGGLHKYESIYANKNQKGYIDDVLVVTGSRVYDAYGSAPAYISFFRSGPSFGSDGNRIYANNIYHNGVLVFDAIIVRFTNEDGVSEGAMYDKVSGKLYRNAGTGAFIIGPDKTI